MNRLFEKWFVRFVGVVCVWMLGEISVSASAAECTKLIKAKVYLKAATCYEQAAQQVDQDASQKAFATLLKERYFRYSALAYQKAANHATGAQKAFYLERAVEQLVVTFRERFCRAARRCRQNQLLADKLKAQIRYGTLVISSKDPKATISVKGFQFLQVRQKDFTSEVRPGKYLIRIQFPGKPAQEREVEVPPGDRVLLDVSPTKLKLNVKRLYTSRRLPPLILASYIGGALAIVAGSALGAYGLFRQTSVNARMGEPKENVTYPDKEHASDLGTAQVLTVVGMSVLGLGIAIVVGGAVAQQTLNPSKKGDMNKPKQATSMKESLHKAPILRVQNTLARQETSRVLWRSF